MLHSKESLLAIMDYKNSHIAFEELNGKMMINATQMGKPFGKNPRQWLRTQQAKDLIKTISKVQKCTLAEIQVVRRGGNNPGTFFQEDAALMYAQWLSPGFYLACNTKLKELLATQALNIPSRHGVKGMLFDGRIMYAYTDAMRALGGSVKASASRRKAKHPEHFAKFYGRNFITGHYLDLLHSYYSWKKASNQLKLSI